MYGSKLWPTTEIERRKIEITEMRLLRKTIMDRIRSETFIERLKTKPTDDIIKKHIKRINKERVLI